LHYLALYAKLDTFRPLIQEDSKWQQAFLGRKFTSTLEVRLGLDGGD